MTRDILISTAAKRYARALLQIAVRQKNLTTVLEQLETFSEQLRLVRILSELFLNPAVPQEKKRKILEDLGKHFHLDRLTVDFLSTIVRRDRLRLLDQIIVSAEQQFLDSQGIVVVQVTTARKLQPEEEAVLSKKLEQFTGKKVQMENHLDPDLLGGAITRIGTTVYDGSVQAQLEQLRNKITQRQS